MNFNKLWRQRLKSILEQIATGETDYQEVANLAEHIGADYHDRFLIELLQNAEDQTTKAAIDNGLAIVVRTGTHVYVLNQGMPFDDLGIRSITSAGMSPKKAEESIGNKGIGFKAVFQVSSNPEIFTAEKGMTLTAEDRIGFRINHDLFSNEVLQQLLEATTHEVLCADSELRKRLESYFHPDEMWPNLLKKLKHAAPFKFPQVLGNEEFEAHLDTLSIPKRLLDRMTTLVVLPLINDDDTTGVVESALNELASSDNIAGSALLFLQGISRLRIYDHVRNCAWLVSRHEVEEPHRLDNGAKITPIRTTSACVFEAGQTSRTRAEWWRIRRRFGREGDDVDSRQDEMARIKTAVSRLPVQLRDIQTAYASVGLPRCLSEQSLPELLLTKGRMCIGLPTLMATGTPAWLDGPFHGNVARTEINLAPDSQPYNRLIFEECVGLLWQVIEHVKAVGDINDKRQVLFWFASTQGALATHFKCKNMLSTAKIILAPSGNEFLAAEDLRLPEDVDGTCFESLFGHVPKIEDFGFRLPDPLLLQKGRMTIDSLTDQPCFTVPISTYVDRPKNGKSLIETGCLLSRNKGSKWWEPFFHWLTERLQTDDLRNQTILPIVGGKLASPDDRVFLRPRHGLSIEEDSSGGNEEDEEVIDDLDPTLAESLRLLDEECVKVRVDGSQNLTELARKLSPDGSAGLVRRPRRPELINDVLVPVLCERVKQDPRDTLCIRLLTCVGEWLAQMTKQTRARVHLGELRAPTTNDQGVWSWRRTEELYLGTGWVSDTDHEHLLKRAFGHRVSARLPSWDDFEGWVRTDSLNAEEQLDRDAWRRYMEEMGVHAQPRVLVDRPKKGYFKSRSRDYLSLEDYPDCPFDAAANLWHDYLNYLCQRPARVTRQPFFARPLSWIDGLEDPDTREAVIKIVLRRPGKYEQFLWTDVERHNGSDSCKFPSLWMWAIQKERWAVVPSNDGSKPIDTVWILQIDQRRRRFVEEKLLNWIPEEFNRSPAITAALGVYSPDNAPAKRIILELHQVAERLSADGSTEQATRMLVQTLYEWLLNRCENQESGNSHPELASLLKHPIPLMRGDRIESVDLNGGACVYLNDDVQRSPHIAGFATGYALPLSAKSSFKALFDGLQHLLGPDRVRRVSQEPINLDFSMDIKFSEGQLLELIEQSLGTSPDGIELQLAALIAYGRSEYLMEPSKQTFREHWGRMRNCRVVFGKFGATGTADQALYDARAQAGPTLFIASNGTKIEDPGHRGRLLVQQSWRVIGPGYRDAFEAFAGVLLSGREREFLRERRIGDSEWDEVQTAIGASLDLGRTRLRVFAFALWRRRHPLRTASEFDSEWEKSGNPIADVAHFFDVDDATARARINDAQIIPDEVVLIHRTVRGLI